MQGRICALVPLVCAAALSACGGGGGGGSSVTIGGFTSWSALRPGTTSTLVAMTREADYTYDPDTGLLTGVGAGSPLATDSSLTLGLDAAGEVNLLAIETPQSNLSLSVANGDLFGDLGGGLLAAVSADESKLILAADPIALGWNYQTFGVWDTVFDADSGRIGAFSAGAPTPVSAVPTSGTATYTGMAGGFHADAAGATSLTSAMLRSMRTSVRAPSRSRPATRPSRPTWSRIPRLPAWTSRAPSATPPARTPSVAPSRPPAA